MCLEFRRWPVRSTAAPSAHGRQKFHVSVTPYCRAFGARTSEVPRQRHSMLSRLWRTDVRSSTSAPRHTVAPSAQGRQKFHVSATPYCRAFGAGTSVSATPCCRAFGHGRQKFHVSATPYCRAFGARTSEVPRQRHAILPRRPAKLRRDQRPLRFRDYVTSLARPNVITGHNVAIRPHATVV